MTYVGIITAPKVNYEQVNPEFKNEDSYDYFAKNTVKNKNKINVEEEVAKYFSEKCRSKEEGNSDTVFRPYSTVMGGKNPAVEQKGGVFDLLYDFRYPIIFGFAALNFWIFAELVYEANRDKNRVKRLEIFSEGKGIVTRLTPLNPT